MNKVVLSLIVFSFAAAGARAETGAAPAMGQLANAVKVLKLKVDGVPKIPVAQGPRDADKKEQPLVHPPKGRCPSDDELVKNENWVEHAGGNPPARVLKTHFAHAYAGGAGMNMTPRSRPMAWLWLGGHTNQGWKFRGTGRIEAGCFVIGTVAYYKDRWPPSVDFLNKGEAQEKAWFEKGAIKLLELRWYDPADGRRHRWYNSRLGSEIGWPARSPIPLPMPINSLY